MKDILAEIKAGRKPDTEETGDCDVDGFDYGNKPAAPDPNAVFYTPGEMAAMLRIPLRTLEKWVLQRKIPVVKVGRLNRFPRVEIEKRLLSGSLLR
jgi:excisionase family DNA binding protein